MNARSYVVTTSIGRRARDSQWTRLWNGEAPLMLGHPFQWALERTEKGVRIRSLVARPGVAPVTGLHQEIPFESIAKGAALELQNAAAAGEDTTTPILFQIRNARDWSAKIGQPIPQAKELDDQTAFFKKSARYAGIALATFVVLSLIWPKPKPSLTEELIPAQVAKIILSQPKQQPAESGRGGSQAPVKKAQDAAVVQAFRAKALQSAVSGLLKGGMTHLLAQSDFITGPNATASARRIFDGKSSALASTAPATGLINGRQVAVGGLGGTGGGPGGTGIGYGKGQHAGVSGQGRAFVSMDIPGASVEEGLTKDEVGAVIHQHMSEIRYCYESAMIRTPDLEGKLMVDFTIGGTGVVKSTAIKSSTLSDPRLDDCILRRLTTWKFPQPKGGIDVAVAYPFIFKTLGR